MSINNIDMLLKRLSRMDAEIQNDIMLKAIKRADIQIQKQARLLAPYNSRALQRSIKTNEEVKGTKIIGSVYTNLDYAIYPEVGTGPVGQKNHEGISPVISPRYTQKGWMIPVSEISSEEAEMYHFKPVMKNGKIIGYYTMGQPARPYLYPAIKNQEKGLQKIVGKYITKRLKESCKK